MTLWNKPLQPPRWKVNQIEASLLDLRLYIQKTLAVSIDKCRLVGYDYK